MKKIAYVAFGCTVLFLNACSKSDSPNNSYPADKQSQIVVNYSNILEAGYQDSYNAAIVLQTKINDFIASPSAQGLADAKTAWLAAREPYMQTEIARFYGGPIDGDDGDALLNSWPLDEGYIDYLLGDPHSYAPYVSGKMDTTGIINMPVQYPNITEAILVQNNQPDGGTTNANGDPVDVSVGYHAIEFLLWGQDDTPAVDKIPGQRSYKDYLTNASATAPNGDRRAIYLKVVTQLLVDNLKEMVDAWAPNHDNYRKSFEATPALSIANIFNGVGRLAKGELAAQRMAVPLALHAQEQEHSCFSDNTHRDLWLDMQGIVNVYTGEYTRVDGSKISGLGLTDFVKAQNATDDQKMQTLLASAQSTLKTIEDNKPFDWLIDGANPSGNVIVQNSVTAISAVADWVSQIAHDLNLSNVNVTQAN